MCLTQKKRDRCSCTFKKFWLVGPAGGFVVEDEAGRANGYLLPLKTTKEDMTVSNLLPQMPAKQISLVDLEFEVCPMAFFPSVVARWRCKINPMALGNFPSGVPGEAQAVLPNGHLQYCSLKSYIFS